MFGQSKLHKLLTFLKILERWEILIAMNRALIMEDPKFESEFGTSSPIQRAPPFGVEEASAYLCLTKVLKECSQGVML